MKIFIMRHGEAAHFASSDAERALTANGQAKNKQMAKWLATKLDSLDLVLVSPYLRAEQTWQNCQALLPNAKKVLIEDGITPYGDSGQVASYLKALISVEQPETVLIVSHLPLVNYLAEEFDPSARALSFATSAVCEIEYDSQTESAQVVDFKAQ